MKMLPKEYGSASTCHGRFQGGLVKEYLRNYGLDYWKYMTIFGERTKSVKKGRHYHPTRRWVIERTNSWHNTFRKLLITYEKKAENYLGLVHLSCCITVYRRIILGYPCELLLNVCDF